MKEARAYRANPPWLPGDPSVLPFFPAAPPAPPAPWMRPLLMTRIVIPAGHVPMLKAGVAAVDAPMVTPVSIKHVTVSVSPGPGVVGVGKSES